MDWKTRISALFLWIFVVLSAVGNGNAEKRVVCYYTNWSVYRPGTAKFSPQNINPYLCTHLIYAFGGFTKENTLKPFDKYQDIEKGGYAKFTGLKTYNKDLKTMLAIGGWNEGSSRFSPMVADPGRRKEFVKNTVKFLRQNHFDGLDLDWEYPAFRDGGKPRDRDNYADLVQELREEFERESSKTGRPRLLLSMAVPAGIEYIDKGYDVPRLNEYLDFINLLSYDYHSAYEPAANHHSPLFPLEEDNEYNYDTELTIDFTITHLLKSGASSEKIVLGIPTYGRSYTLFNEEATDIGAPADGPGEEGDATREKGYLAYYEICESIAKSDEWQVVQPNPSAMGPYAFRGNQWVGYDDENIVRAKARYVNEKKLGGIMFWSIDNDDFRGKCHGRPYPLIEAAKEAMLVEDDSATKTRVSDSRKKSRPQGGQRPQVNSISRKFKTGRRTTTTETPSTKRRISSGSRSNSRSNGRARGSEHVEDDEEDNEEEANSVKSSEKPRQRTRSKNTRLRNQSLGGGRKKQQNSRNHEEKKNEEPEEETRSKKLTTPEPPTTPDPGTDFKCEDEGFFPHPRDCKKYFWCLDSGPGGLGIVGHQFTCPSGLVFNKAADSCDYPRNVVCPKTKTTQSAVTTTRAPITAATSRTTYLHKPSPRTTTPKADSDEEYEYYDDEEVDEDAADSRETEEQVRSTTTPKTYKTISRNRPTTTDSPTSTTTEPTTSTRASKTTTERDTSYEDEEDPRVIKELIDLIKKAGGIEQLEKQLLYQDKNSGGNAETTEGNGKSTPATISRSLYERVLNRQATRIAGGFLGSFSTTQSSKSPKGEENAPKNSRTGFINGPGGAQFEGLDQVPEVKSLRRTTKHQYVTIDRQRQTTSESPADEDEELEEEDEDDNKNVASSEDRAVSSSQEKSSNRRFTPSYVNIRRSRPSTTTSENDVDLKDEGDDTLEEESGESGELEEPVTEGRKVLKSDGEASAPKSRYTNVQRFRSTTLRHSVEDATEEAPLKKDAKSATSTTSTTTEKMISVTEEVSETPTTLSTTIAESSSSESLENEKLENSTQQLSSDDASSTSEPETTKTNNDATLRLVENSATEILLTTVPASSISTGSNYDSFTRGPTVAAVSQPRPFGFSRRGRPTTTAIPPTASAVTEQTRTKVDSETLRLPTLKELVGFTFSTLSKDSSGSQLTKSMTTLPSIDTTIVVNDQRDQSEEGELVKNQVDAYDRFEGTNESEDSHNLSSESATNEKDILDNDILSSEEIQRRSSPVLKIETEKEPEKVEVPVRILDDTNGEEIAELVLLRVPQSKLSSAALKPILRVKILDQENQEVPGEPEQRKNIEKVENRPESSSENELSDRFRPTSGRRRKINSSRGGQDAEAATKGLQDRPRSRQRIVKARRRTRPLQAQGQEDEVKKALTDESPRSQGQQIVRKVTRRRENPEKYAPHTTTLIPEISEPISNTLSPTTLAESHSLASRASNLTRGFYITKDIDEYSTTLDPMTTEFQSALFDDSSSQEIDFTTQEIGSTTQTLETTFQDVGVTTSQGDETATSQEQTEYTTESIESSVQDQRPTTSLETATPDYVSTMIDETTESSVPTTESRSNNEPAITTFRPRITEKATTPVELTTTEFSTNSSVELEEDGAVTKSRETSEDHSESLKTSENNYLRSTMIAEPSKTDGESKTSSTGFDERYEAQGRIFEAANSTESTKITSGLNEISVTSEMRKFEVETATMPVQSSLDQFSKKVEPEAESSPQKTTTNFNRRTTSRQETTNRGGVRFTTTGKSSIPIDRSSSRNGNETHKSTSENLVSSTNSATTKSYALTGRTTRKQETVERETNSLPPTTPSRRRGNVRKTTRPPKISDTTRSADSSVTDEYKNIVGTRVKDRSTLTTSNYDQANVARTKNSRVSSRGRPNDWRTTESPEINKTGSDSVTRRTLNSRSTTEAYGEAVDSSTRAESSYGTTNFEQETTSSSEASNSFLQVSREPKKLNESSESRANVIDTSDPNESHVTIPGTTETVDKTSRSQEISTNRENDEISSTRSFESSDVPSTMSPEYQKSNDSSSNVIESKFIEETSQAMTSSVPTNSPTTNFVQPTEGDVLSSRSSVSGSETTRSSLSEDSSNYSTSIDESWTKIPMTTEIDEETFDTESSAPTTVYPATEFTGSTDDPSEKSTTLDDETNTFSRTIEPLDKNTEATNSDDTSVTYGVTTTEAKETTSGYEGTSIPWLHVTGNENIDVRETTMVNTLKIIESTTPSYVKNDSYSVVTNLPVEWQRTEGTEKEIPQENKNDVTTEANNQKTISDNDISGKPIETTVRIDATPRGTNSPEKESFLHNVIPSRATWTTANWENSVLSTLGASSTSRAPSVQQEPKRPRGRVRFTNFAGISDDANEEARRPIKQLVVRRRLAKDRQRVATTTESNLIKTEASPIEKNQKTRFTRIKNVSARQDVEKKNQIDKSDEITRRIDSKNQNELADRGPNEKTNSSKTPRRRVVVYRGRPRPENISTTLKPVTTTTPTVPSPDVSSGENADNDKSRRRRKWRKRIVLKRSRLEAEEDDQSIAETGVVGRALIDGDYVESSPDAGSYILMPDVVEKSSEPEDSTGEANPFKSSGAFLRRPGTLVRNDALNRLRSKVPKTLVPAPTLVPFAKIQSVDPTYEMKTEDQSVRAQELAVTLSDPPASDPSSTTGRSGLRKQGTTRKISTTVAPRTETTSAPKTTAIVRRRQSPRRNNNNLGVVETPVRPRRPAIIDYDYYVDDEIRLVLKPELKDKLFVTKKGAIRCLDQGNFAHPTSCKKFITCARMGNGQVVGTEYTCPDKLSFDPVGGICNWSAGLGCEDKTKTSK